MADLRARLADAGLDDPRTYLQSGNVVVRSDEQPDALAQRAQHLISEHFQLSVGVVVRTRNELAEVVARDPFAGEEVVEKLYQVTFLANEPPAGLVDQLAKLAVGGERFVADGRSWYVHYPAGIARSKLATRIAARNLGVLATARNWTTVRSLLELAQDV